MNEVEKWELALIRGLPLPDVPVDVLLAHWKKVGFTPEVLPILRERFTDWWEGHPKSQGNSSLS